ncbi:MAG: phosphatase PAP2 family protein [Ignavibacteriae bacterium]|nr:phosphatase PAP2 family protein [Ignavibacteriota bacterium]
MIKFWDSFNYMGSDSILFKKLSIIDFLNLIVLSIFITFYFIGFDKTPYKGTLAIWYSLLFLFIIIISRIRSSKKDFFGKKFILLIYPLLFFFSLFESFFMILPYFNSYRYDSLMINIDHFMFGVHPTVWIEKIINPYLTELMHIAYFFYFPMPLILVILLFYRKQYKNLEESLILLFITYYGAYITYFLVPVEGPRFHLAHLQTIPLNGIILSQPIMNFIDFFEPNKLDCFPSLHAAIMLVTMFITFKYAKKLFYFYMPWAILIMISLVYCRFHYVIDILAGTVLAVLCVTLGRMAYLKLRNKFIFHFNDSTL